jgi:hypothetical protein
VITAAFAGRPAVFFKYMLRSSRPKVCPRLKDTDMA